MAIETVVIKITGDSKDINKTIDQLEKLGKVDRENSKSFKKTSAQNQKNIKKTESALGGLQKQAISLGTTLIGAFAIQQFVTSAIRVLRDFEKELSTLQSITGQTREEMEFFSKAAKEIGKATKTSATEVVKAFTLIGSAQPELLKNSEALADVTEQALILSKAAGIDTVAAAEALTSAMNQFGASADEAAKFTDIFATSQQKGSSFINATSEALKNAGAAANAAGLSFETTNAAIQALAKGALNGAEAGTSLRGVLIKLSSQTDDSINPSLVGLGNTIKELAKRNLTLAQATKLVGQEGATGLLTLIKQKDIFFELDGTLNDTGNALEQMAINTDNLDGSIIEVGLAFEDFILALNEGDGFLARFTRGVVDLAKEFLELGTSLATLPKVLQEIEDELLKGAISSAKHQEALRPTNGLIKQQIELLIAQKKVQQEERKEEESRIRTIGDLKKELQELRKAQNDLIPGSKQLATNQARVKEILVILKGSTEKLLTPLQELRKRISALKNELLNQALAGNISEDSLAEYKLAVEAAEKSQEALNDAIGKTVEELEREREAIANLAAKQATQANLQQEIENQQRDELQQTFDLAEELGLDATELFAEFAESGFKTFAEFEQKKRDEVEKTLQDQIDAVLEVIAITNAAQEQAFAVLQGINTRKLILIDNEQIAEERKLEAKFEKGRLTEEQLAEAQLKIQKEADKERALILTKQAKQDKIAAIIQATINTAIAVTRALATGNVVLAAFVALLGAAEIATIASQPIPTFHEGKKAELKPGEINAVILESESVIPPKQSARHKGLIDAVIDDNLKDYVFKHYQLPILKAQMSDPSLFDDRNITGKQSKTNKLLAENNRLLKGLKMSSNRQSYGWN